MTSSRTDQQAAREDARAQQDRERKGQGQVEVCVLFDDISFRNAGEQVRTAVKGDVVSVDQAEYERLMSDEGGLPGARYPVRKATSDDKKAMKQKEDARRERLEALEERQAAGEEEGELTVAEQQERALRRAAAQNRRSLAAGHPDQPAA